MGVDHGFWGRVPVGRSLETRHQDWRWGGWCDGCFFRHLPVGMYCCERIKNWMRVNFRDTVHSNIVWFWRRNGNWRISTDNHDCYVHKAIRPGISNSHDKLVSLCFQYAGNWYDTTFVHTKWIQNSIQYDVTKIRRIAISWTEAKNDRALFSISSQCCCNSCPDVQGRGERIKRPCKEKKKDDNGLLHSLYLSGSKHISLYCMYKYFNHYMYHAWVQSPGPRLWTRAFVICVTIFIT